MTAKSLGPNVTRMAFDRCTLTVIASDVVTDDARYMAKAVMIYSDEAIGK